MKSRKKICSLLMAFVMLILSVPPVMVSAATKEPQLTVTIVGGGVSTELSYNGKNVLGTTAWYTNNEGKKMPAYCMDPTAKGPGEVASKQYDVNIAGANMDTHAAGCILEGYPYKSPAELGLSSPEEAYAATKAAIWCGLGNSPYTNINAWSASDPKVLVAMKGIIERANSHSDVTLALYSIKSMTEPEDDGTYTKQTFKPEANYPIMDFVPELMGDYPSGTTVRKEGGSYTVSVPNASITEPGNVQVKVLLRLKSEVVLYGDPVDISGVQRLEVPMIPYEVNVESNTPYKPVDSPTPPTEGGGSGKLKIIKTEDGTNKGLAGAKFEVTDHLGGVLGVFTTSSDGTVTVQTNGTGAFGITEIVPPIGFALDENNHKDVRVDDDRETVVNFSNKKLPSIEIIKVDDNDPDKKLSGATFTVALDGGSESFDVITGSNGGVVLSEGLKPNQTYKITEKTAPKDYQLNTEPQYIKTVAGEKQTVVFSNKHKPGVIVKKYDMDTAELLPDCEVSIRYKGGAIIWEGLTDAYGEVFIENIDVGANGKWIEIVELAAPPGYIKSQEIKEVFLKPGMSEPVVVKLDNRKKPVLEILKVDEEGNPLEGAVIYVKQTESETVSEYITPKSGKIEIILDEEAIYSVWEHKSPDGYIKEATCHKDIKLSAGEKKQLVFVNKKAPVLEILKIDKVTKKPVANTKYKVTYVESETVSEYITGDDGKIIIKDMKEGIVRVEETIANDDYLLDSEAKEIKLSAGDKKQLIFENTKKPTIVISKKNALTGKGIPNTTYLLQYENPNGGIETLGTYRTDAQGQIILPKMKVGWYIITEKIPASGMQLPSNPVTRVYLGAGENTYALAGEGVTNNGDNTGNENNNGSGNAGGETENNIGNSNEGNSSGNSNEGNTASTGITVGSGHDYVNGEEIINYPLNSIVVKKENAITSELLEGAAFELIRVTGDVSGSSGTTIGRYTTDSSGILVFTGCEEGGYIVKEVTPPNGYLLSKNSSQQVWLKPDGTSIVELTFSNYPYGSLLILKQDNLGERLKNIRFKVTDSKGAVVGNANGEFVTDENGEILISNLKPDSYVVTEIESDDYHQIDTTPQTIHIGTDGKTYKLTFVNGKLGTLTVKKISSVDRSPIESVSFSLSKISGEKIGEFVTGKDGMFHVDKLDDGTYKLQELKNDGYVVDDEPKIFEIKDGKPVVIEVENTPVSSILIQKTSDGGNEKPLKGVMFEIRKDNGELIGNDFKTDAKGRIFVEVEPGEYHVTEIKGLDGYEVDDTIHKITVEAGKQFVLRVKNTELGGIRLKKIDADTKEGIYNVEFMVFDRNKNVVGTFYTDNKGLIDFTNILEEGRYTIRETRPAAGYYTDNIPRTIEVVKGKVTELVWENKGENGQIVITKRSSEFNELTGLPAGAPLEGAVFEIYNITGNMVSKAVSDSKGVAASKLLPVGVYTFKEVSAPRYYALNDRTYIAEIRHNGDIIRFEVLNSSIALNLSVQKKGQHEVSPGTTMNYEIYGVANDSSGVLESFYIHDRIPTDATRATKITTGTFNERMYYKITYKTNYRDYMTLADNLLTSNDYEYSLHPNVLGLQNGEYVTDVRLEFPKVSPGFKQIKSMQVFCQVLPTVPNGYNIMNRADVGGRYGNEWESAKTSWNTSVRATQIQTVKLPKTGY